MQTPSGASSWSGSRRRGVQYPVEPFEELALVLRVLAPVDCLIRTRREPNSSEGVASCTIGPKHANRHLITPSDQTHGRLDRNDSRVLLSNLHLPGEKGNGVECGREDPVVTLR